MIHKPIADRSIFCRKISLSLICFLWCFGLSSGFWLLTPSGPLISSVMYTLASERGPIVGLLVVNILPFLIFATAIRYKVSCLVLPLIFMKAFFMGYDYSFALCVFASAGWLVCLLLYFSQIMSAVLLLWYCIRNINYTGIWHGRELCGFLVAGFVLSCIAHYGIATIRISVFVS